MTDICNPSLLWLDGICYRVPANTEIHNYEVTPGYSGEAQEYYEDDDCDVDTSSHDIVQLDNGNYRATMQVASAFFPQIIGKGGQTKTRLEIDTKTKIFIPRKGQDGDITVTGVGRLGVIAAANRIDVMVASARNKQPFTHFLSIPVNTDQTKTCFTELKGEILETRENVRGLDASIFQTDTLLHLTIGTMALLDERERNIARYLQFLTIFHSRQLTNHNL